MRKKLYLGLIIAAVIAAATACGGKNAEISGVEEKTEETETTVEQEVSEGEAGLKEIRLSIGAHAETVISAIEKEYEDMTSSLGDTYETYLTNKSVLTEWYSSTLSELETAYSSINEQAINYYRMVPTHVDVTDSDAVDSVMDDFYDDIYEDVLDEFYDRIYEGLFDRVYDDYYDGVIDDGEENVDYGDWLDVRSEFYDSWLDARSDFYDSWLDIRSDIYSDWLDVKGEIKSGNFDIEDILGGGFMEEINESSTEAIGENSLEALRKNIGIKAETTISGIENSYEELKNKLGNTYDSYVANESALTDWYATMLNTSKAAFESIDADSVNYYKSIPNTVDTSNRDAVEDAMDDFKDDIYEDVMDEFKDRIYDGVLDNLKDDYYDGVIEDGKDTVDWDEWYEVQSRFYDNWYKAQSNYYDLWYEAQSDIYSDWFDVNSEFWSGNFDVDGIIGGGFMDEIQEELSEETLGETAIEAETTTAAETTEAETMDSEAVPETEAVEQNITAENNSDFKALIEDKEPSGDMQKAFVDKYEGQTIEFDGNIAFISNHGDYSTRYDVLVYAGDYSEVSVSGPAFQFNDVGVTELTGELFLPDYVKIGSNVHIVATVYDYNDGSGLLLLRPKSIEQR